MQKLMAVLYILFLISDVLAQFTSFPVNFDGEIRLRSEANGRDFDNDTDLNTYTLLRTRFGVQAKPLEDVCVYFQVQDSRVLGTEPSTQSNTSTIDLHQAYFLVSNIWNLPVELKIGRQEFVFGGQRLMGPDEFSNIGRSFEGIKLTLGRDRNIDIFGTIITESSPPSIISGTDNADFNFLGVYYKYRRRPQLTLDTYLFIESNLKETISGDDELNRFTTGMYYQRKFQNGVDVESELAYQFGKRQGQRVSAFMLTGSLGYTFAISRKPQLLVEYSYLSGMDNKDGNYKAFDTLFATNHKFYGFMDYFLNIPIDTENQGLQDFVVKVKLPINNGLRLDAHYHNFHTASGAKTDFGDEFDLVLSYLYNAVTSFQFGITFFQPGERMTQVFSKNDIGVWSFMTFLVKF